MASATVFDPGTQTRVRRYARALGITDERAVAAALDRAGRSARGLDEACALLRSWHRHPSSRPPTV